MSVATSASWTRKTKHRTQYTEPSTSVATSTFRTHKTKHRTQYTEPNTQNPIHRTQYTEPNIQNPTRRLSYPHSGLMKPNMDPQHDCITVANKLHARRTQDPEPFLELAPDGRTSRTQVSSRMASIFQTLPPAMMTPMLKKSKPPLFSGEDTSLAIVNAWIFKICAPV